MDDDLGGAQHRGDVPDTAWQEQRLADPERPGLRLQRCALRPLAEHDEHCRRMRLAHLRQCAHRDIEAFLAVEPRHGDEQPRPLRHAELRSGTPGGGRRVHPVVDGHHLRGRQPDTLDGEVAERVGDRDDTGGTQRQQLLGEAERAGAERVVVVLRRDERGARSHRGDGAVEVAVDEMRVHEIGASGARGARDVHGEPQVEVARAGQPLVWHAGRRERLVERARCERGVVEAEEAGVHAALAQGGQQGQQVPFGAADTADAVDVQRSHAPAAGSPPSGGACGSRRARHRRASSTAAPAAASAIRKSKGTR
jgi:hypothetical protein